MSSNKIGVSQQISCGANYSLFLRFDSTLWAWGNNCYGQLGTGTNLGTYIPVQINIPFEKIIFISCGLMHSMAIAGDGTLWSWGGNIYGQLGIGSLLKSVAAPTKVNIPCDNGVKAVSVACGARHSMVCMEDGSVWAWGDNSRGQLGTASTTREISPVHIDMGHGKKATSVTCGKQHSLILFNDSSVYSCGDNSFGQLGIPAIKESYVPLSIPNFEGAVNIYCGSNYSIVMKANDNLFACGDNSKGQLGIASDDINCFRMQPVHVYCAVQKVACGSNHSIALGINGEIWSWGSNNSGQVGNSQETGINLPVLIDELYGVSNIACGAYHTMASTGNFPVAVYGWGNNSYGQLGNGLVSKRLSISQAQLPIIV